MEYQVTVNGIKYLVTISPSIRDANNVENASDITYEIAKSEYEHTIHRLDRLDNKVYILLTACAFLFSVVYRTLQESSLVLPPKSLKDGLILLSVITFSLLLVLLIILLKGVELNRFSVPLIAKHDLVHAEKKHVAKYICSIYVKCTVHNNDALETRYKIYNCCVILMVVSIVSLLLLATIKFV